MLHSVRKKQEELLKELDQVNALAEGLEDDIRQQLEEPENHPVITPAPEPIKVNDENDELAMMKMPATPPKINKVDYAPHVAEIQLTHSTDSTAVELGDDSGAEPRVIEHHHLHHQQHPHTPHTPRTPAGQEEQLVHSPANSCPMPISNSLDHPYIDCQTQGLPRYRVNTEDDIHGLTWAGFGCGSSLFGERLLEQDANPSANIMQLSFDDILVDSGGANHARQNHHESHHSVNGETSYSTDNSSLQGNSSLQSGSFDGGTVNFRTGMSGHTGLSLARKRNSPMSRYRQIPMMSAHRGIPAARGTHPQHAPHGLQPRKPPHDHF